MRSVLLLIALLLTACEETISLGSECPRHSGACPVLRPGDGDGDGDGDAHAPDASDEQPGSLLDGGRGEPDELDASGTDAGRVERDAGTILRDASAPEDAGPALFPEFIQNPSFELTDGGTTGPLPRFEAFRPSAIAPWYNCGGTATSVQSSTATGPSRAAQGDTFLTYALPISPVAILNGLAQNLSEPLRPGQRYGFAVDVWSESLTRPTLEIAGGSLNVTGCIFGMQMGGSPPIEPGGWRKACVAFTAPKESVTTIMLIVNAGGNFATTLHIDNIRSDPECGN